MSKPEGECAGWMSESHGCYCDTTSGCINREKVSDCQEIKKFWPQDLSARIQAEREEAERLGFERGKEKAAKAARRMIRCKRVPRTRGELAYVSDEVEGFIRALPYDKES